ncbi:MAG: hypothetical protein P8N02_05450 [Actinomycetota bacterium]|nr:hypothetical protein [Actinomycetota bacterium]
MIAYGETRGWDLRKVLPKGKNRLDLRPSHFDSCDWRSNRGGRPGPAPAYFEYVCHSACHWLVNLNLFVAMQAEPDRPWRIVRSDEHSTVWDGDVTLWDTNFLALRIDVDEAWTLAAEQPESEVYPPGRYAPHRGQPNDDPLNQPIETSALAKA